MPFQSQAQRAYMYIHHPDKAGVVVLTCLQCGAKFERYKSQLRPGGTYCSGLCQRRGTASKRKRSGPEHHAWKGGVEYRRKAFEAKGEACERCGYDRFKRLLWVHHKNLKPRVEQDDHSLENLEVLCIRCHQEIHLEHALSEPGAESLDVYQSS